MRGLARTFSTSSRLHTAPRLPVSESGFRQIRESGLAYVDKTGLIDDMIACDHRFVLCRPPSFGKTVTVTLLRELFQGNRDLFDGTVGQRLQIADAGWDWNDKHQVFEFDLQSLSLNPIAFRSNLIRDMALKAAALGNPLDDLDSVRNVTRDLIQAGSSSSRSGQCVVLVDNYDFPIRQENPWLSRNAPSSIEENLATISEWVSALKAEEIRIRFQFFTGAYKVKTQYVDAPADLSLSGRFSGLCGYTNNDLKNMFPNELDQLARRHRLRDVHELLDMVNRWYGGYSWGDTSRDAQIHNPYSVNRLLMDREFTSYWADAVTVPEWIRHLLESCDLERLCQRQFLLSEVLDSPLEAPKPSTEQSPLDDLLQLHLLQLGLLTIRSVAVDSMTNQRVAWLRIPNRDVQDLIRQSVPTPITKSPTINAA